jgi:hypothetical protein
MSERASLFECEGFCVVVANAERGVILVDVVTFALTFKNIHRGALTLPGAKTATDVAVLQVLSSSTRLSVPLMESSQSIGDRTLEHAADVTWVRLYSSFRTCGDA